MGGGWGCREISNTFHYISELAHNVTHPSAESVPFLQALTAQMMDDLFAPQPTDLLPLMVTIHFKSERYFSHPLWPVGGSNNLEFTFTPASSPTTKDNAASSDSIEAKNVKALMGCRVIFFNTLCSGKKALKNKHQLGRESTNVNKYQIKLKCDHWSIKDECFFCFFFKAALFVLIFYLNDFNLFFFFLSKNLSFFCEILLFLRFEWLIYFL